MAAIVTIEEHNSATPDTRTDKTGGTVRCKKADNATVDSVDNLVKPGVGLFDRSYEKWLRLRIGATAATGLLSNPQFYTSGSTGGGSVVYIRTTNATVYATPAIPADDTAGTDITTYVTGSRKSLGTIAAQTINTNIADFAVLWMTIDDTISAPQNPTSTLVLNFAYDET